MSYVFISYSSKNLQAALDVKNMLQQNGVQCWMAPECIAPGANYTEAIPAAIGGCFAFVLILTGDAQNSQWVTKELDMALNKNKPVVPFHMDTTMLTGQYDFMLAGCQRIEAYSRVPSAYCELLEILRRIDPTAVVPGKNVPRLAASITTDSHKRRIPKEKKADGKIAVWVPFVLTIAAVLFIVGGVWMGIRYQEIRNARKNAANSTALETEEDETDSKKKESDNRDTTLNVEERDSSNLADESNSDDLQKENEQPEIPVKSDEGTRDKLK